METFVFRLEGFSHYPSKLTDLQWAFSCIQAVVIRRGLVDWFAMPHPDRSGSLVWQNYIDLMDEYNMREVLKNNSMLNLRPMPQEILDLINKDHYVRVADFLEKYKTEIEISFIHW